MVQSSSIFQLWGNGSAIQKVREQTLPHLVEDSVTIPQLQVAALPNDIAMVVLESWFGLFPENI